MKPEINLVKTTCKEVGITQKELANIIGLTDRTLSKYATTHSPPKHIKNHINLIIKNLEYQKICSNFKPTKYLLKINSEFYKRLISKTELTK